MSRPSIDDNGEAKSGWTGKMARNLTWREFDSLPWRVRRLYVHAPYDYTAVGALNAWRSGADLTAFLRGAAAGWRDDVSRETLRLYGPTHPQAERRS